MNKSIDILDHDQTGSGPLAVYGHGLFFSRAVEDGLGFMDWSPIPRAGLRLVRYDARGHGLSPGRPDPGEYTFQRHGANLLDLLDHLGADRPVHGLGSSLGSAALLWAAVTAPARFDRLVVVVPPRAWAERPASADVYRGWADQIDREGVAPFLNALSGVGPPPILAGVSGFPPVPDIADETLSAVLRGAASSDLPAPEKLADLTHPTLILAWDTDPTHPVATATKLAETLPNARIEVARTFSEVRGWGDRAAQFLTE
ncbi:alpha/beta fold hydrolase [Actinophytocola sp.]|uniref:alpha/beta fold hydrolase n=1 Tax=Actinophytocola sp. TaxID=1872138 RepID=UPI00389B29FC